MLQKHAQRVFTLTCALIYLAEQPIRLAGSATNNILSRMKSRRLVPTVLDMDAN